MKHTATLLFVLLFIHQFSFAQSNTQQLDSIVQSYHQKYPEISMSIGFIQDQQEFYTAYGNLSKESAVKVNKNSVFEIASITKIITTNLIAQAVHENKLQLDEYIDVYLPKVYTLHNNIQQKIKISDLGAHISGLPDIDFKELIAQNPQQPTSSVTQATLTQLINNCTTLTDYGTYRYSTIGYALLGQILESVYGKSYEEIVKEKLIAPLQLTNTLTTDFDVPNKTVGYNVEGGAQDFFTWNILASAGLIKSNASDLITYIKSLLNEDSILGKAAILTEKQFYKDDNRVMGLGLMILNDEANTLYLKSGDSIGQSSILCYNRAKNWGIAILLNHRNHKLRNEILKTIYEVVLK
ncbi:serine hydrolase [uncultured Kordia sp.]|uniref:serine hydrolase domain-containing protein n=1 Tax=uncultured Kordia sp. TaxID=507699 RepID=UPI0026169AFB|nr:serine hydrolase domain-containing protein [uncultured Kordia sp.]